jgi:hypothetical protein
MTGQGAQQAQGWSGYFRFVAWVTGFSLAVAAIGAFPVWRSWGPEAVTALAAGCCASWLASTLGGLPIAFAGNNPSQRALASLQSLVLRFGLEIALVLLGAWAGWFARSPFLAGAAASYGILLIVDTRYALTSSRAEAKPLEGH